MHKIDHSTAAAGNQFTDGNPVLGVPSTRVTAKWLNGIQNELSNLVESMGITLDSENNNQVLQAIVSAIQSYGDVPFTIGNNITTWTNITGLVMDKTKVKSAIIVMDIYRKTDSKEICSQITFRPVFFPNLNQWKHLPIIEDAVEDLSGLELQIIASDGRVQYKSSSIAGGSYVGELRYKITKFNNV